MAPFIQDIETGVPAIDAGNEGLRFLLRHMFRPGVECRRGAAGAGPCDHSRCTRIEAILRYVGRNFATQERVMSEGGYPRADHHLDDHAALIDRLSVMLNAQVCADRDGGKVHDLVVHWMDEHARRCDQPLGRWAITRRILDPKR